MKKIILALLCLVGFGANAQSMNYPGESIEMLEGKELKVLPLKESLQEYGYEGFYTDEKLKKNYKNKNSSTKYDALVGKVFKVVSYKPDYSDYIITLDNAETGRLYYKYNKNHDHDYHFEVVGGLNFPEGFFCKYNKIEKKFDYDKAEYYFITWIPCTEDICLRETGGLYSLRVLITASADKKETGLKGLTLTFANGKELSFPYEPVSVEASGSYYNYSASVHPSKEQLQLLEESPIVKKVVGNKEQPVEEGRLIQEYIKCLVK